VLRKQIIPYPQSANSDTINYFFTHNTVRFLIYFILLTPYIYMPFRINNQYNYSNLFMLGLLAVLYSFILWHQLKTRKINIFFFWFSLILINIITLNTLYYNNFFFKFTNILYFIALFYIIRNFGINRDILIKCTNSSYILYLFLSSLVYFSIIEWSNRELNIFEFNILGYKFRTFIGFYGSTAHLDSYSLFIALINYFYNNSRWKYFFVFIGIFFSVGTLRFTPFYSLIIAIIITIIIKFLDKKSSVFFFFFIYFSFFIAVKIIQITGNYNLELILTDITHGRVLIWKDMLYIYESSNNFVSKTLGLDINLFYVSPFGPLVGEFNNPHNSYLRVLIEYGILIFVILFVFISFFLLKIKQTYHFIVCFYILTVGVTNNEVIDTVYPAFILWFLFLVYESEKVEHGHENTVFNKLTCNQR
jgi:hypothetical protein